MRIASLTGAETVVHPVHGTAQVGDDGMFDVSPEFAAELLRFTAHWSTEPRVLDDAERLDVPDLYDADRTLRLLADWRARVAQLQALPAGERPPFEWEPDPGTLGWVSAVLRDDRRALRELAGLRIEVAALLAEPPAGAPVVAPTQTPAGPPEGGETAGASAGGSASEAPAAPAKEAAK